METHGVYMPRLGTGCRQKRHRNLLFFTQHTILLVWFASQLMPVEVHEINE